MRYRRLLIFSVVMVLAFSCGNKDRVPGNIIPREKMQVVLSDMMKADQFLSDYVLNHDTTKKREPESIKLYNKVFAIHDISAKEFYKSLSYYQEHPALLKQIMDSLSKPIEAKSIEPLPVEVQYDSMIPPATIPMRKDSVRKQKILKAVTPD
jgi:hypothetical protein